MQLMGINGHIRNIINSLKMSIAVEDGDLEGARGVEFLEVILHVLEPLQDDTTVCALSHLSAVVTCVIIETSLGCEGRETVGACHPRRRQGFLPGDDPLGVAIANPSSDIWKNKNK